MTQLKEESQTYNFLAGMWSYLCKPHYTKWDTDYTWASGANGGQPVAKKCVSASASNGEWKSFLTRQSATILTTLERVSMVL